MATPILNDAFAHHAWATLRLIEVCELLSPQQLRTAVPGTYGSILETLRHLVVADRGYLYRLSGERIPRIEEATMDLAELRAAMERNAAGWTEILAADLDPEEAIVSRREDGSAYHAPKGIRIAQVLHHGTDHRSQVCTALTTLGVTPPEIDVWDYADQAGRGRDVPAPA